MNYEEFQEALDEADRINYLCDLYAERMAKSLIGRLHKCNCYTVEKLKKELKNYNIHTRTWKD